MSDLRFRTFRMRVYTRLLPTDASAQDREQLVALAERMDEDGVTAFFAGRPVSPQARRVLEILSSARQLGDRINVLDRTLPVLPHAEITECYHRLRALGNEIADLEVAGTLLR
jgi:hypothetical protein